MEKIIDGVDISGCKYRRISLSGICECKEDGLEEFCKDNPLCYYKNWKRAEMKPTYPFNEAFTKMLQETNQKLENCISKIEDAISEVKNEET